MIISLLALLLAALCGCSRLVPSSYTLVTPHDAGAKSEPQSDVLTVRDYKTLKNALPSNPRAKARTPEERGMKRRKMPIVPKISMAAIRAQ